MTPLQNEVLRAITANATSAHKITRAMSTPVSRQVVETALDELEMAGIVRAKPERGEKWKRVILVGGAHA
jgi:hypothetical protein